MIVLIGPTCSGKTTLAKALEEKGYKRKIQYTTRPIREGEVDGVDYHFITKEKFSEMIDNKEFIEFASFKTIYGVWFYGSVKSDYEDEKSVIVLNPLAVAILESKNIDMKVVFLNIDDNTLFKRACERGDDPDEVRRRITKDKNKFYNKDNYITITKETDVDEIIKIIENS